MTTPYIYDVNLNGFHISKSSAFFFGIEKDGLSDKVMSKADIFLKIPGHGFTESFNISMTIALIMHDTTEYLRQNNIYWQLLKTEEEEIYR